MDTGHDERLKQVGRDTLERIFEQGTEAEWYSAIAGLTTFACYILNKDKGQVIQQPMSPSPRTTSMPAQGGAYL